MIRLSDFLKKENILCSLSDDLGESVNLIINNMLETDEKGCSLFTTDDKLSELITIHLKNGFFISHSRRDDIKDIHVGLITFQKKVFYNKKEVKAVFCILVPEKKHRAYLGILAHISRLFSRPSAEYIFSCDNVDKIVEFVKEMEG